MGYCYGTLIFRSESNCLIKHPITFFYHNKNTKILSCHTQCCMLYYHNIQYNWQMCICSIFFNGCRCDTCKKIYKYQKKYKLNIGISKSTNKYVAVKYLCQWTVAITCALMVTRRILFLISSDTHAQLLHEKKTESFSCHWIINNV